MGRITKFQHDRSKLILLTGPREIGKTSLLVNLIDLCRKNDIFVLGIISPAVFTGGQKTAIDLFDLHSGENKRLAELRHGETNGVFTDRWVFNPDVLEWGNQVLGALPPCQLLIIDELGPLELDRGTGLQNALLAIKKHEYRSAIVVIRPELIDKAKALWHDAEVFSVQKYTSQNSNQTTTKLFDKIK